MSCPVMKCIIYADYNMFLFIDKSFITIIYNFQARKMQEKGWKPRWFAKEEGSHSYRYVGGYWETREKGNWESCPDIFGQLSTEPEPNPTP